MYHGYTIAIRDKSYSTFQPSFSSCDDRRNECWVLLYSTMMGWRSRLYLSMRLSRTQPLIHAPSWVMRSASALNSVWLCTLMFAQVYSQIIWSDHSLLGGSASSIYVAASYITSSILQQDAFLPCVEMTILNDRTSSFSNYTRTKCTFFIFFTEKTRVV